MARQSERTGSGLEPICDALPNAIARLGYRVIEDQRTGRAKPFQPINRGGFQAAKESWLKVVASYPILSGADYAVAIVISTHLNSKTGEAWPSIALLAELTNRNRATVWKSIERLIKLRLLQVRKGRGRHKSNRYQPLMGLLNCDPKTLRRRNNSSASWQPKHCEFAERTSE